MDFFISNAFAQEAAAGAAPALLEVAPLLIIFVIFYFVFIRPESRRKKEHGNMVKTLEVRDEIVTSGGLLGKITAIGDNFVQIEVAKGFEVKIRKENVSMLMPKDTLKGL